MNFLAPGPLQIDPEWMTCALRRAGAIRETKVVEMTCKPVGNGLLGTAIVSAWPMKRSSPTRRPG